MRLYAVFVGNQAAGWVRSVAATDRSRWVSNLYVLEEHRRKGIGAGLMAAMVADDATNGYSHSVLTATKEGSKLYERLGYKQVGLLQIFTPVER